MFLAIKLQIIFYIIIIILKILMNTNQISREGPDQLQFLELQGSRQDMEFSN